MGIELIVRAIRRDQMSHLKENQHLVQYFVYGPPFRPGWKEQSKDGLPPHPAYLFTFLWKPDEAKHLQIPDDWEPPAAGDIIDMDKSYDGLHFVLTGKHTYEDDYEDENEQGSVLNCLNGGGDPVGDATVLSPEMVVQLRAELEKINDQELINRLKICDEESNDEFIEYHRHHFDQFKFLVSRAAEHDRALLFQFLV